MRSRPHVIVALTYYSPYVSGLTEYARLVAEGLVRRGWQVTVVATAHQRDLPQHERIAGVEVVRTPVIARIGKGVVSPLFPLTVARLARTADVLHIHLPMLDAAAVAALARSVPLVSTYHCDVNLPSGALNSMQVRAVDASSRMALRRSQRIGVTTLDYAGCSRVAAAMGSRVREVGAPCRDQSGGAARFRRGRGLHVGFLGRLVEEKGIEYLVDGFRALPDRDARLLIAGDYDNVAGGSVVDRVRKHIAGDPRVELLGFLAEEQLADFYASIDVLALPSVNSLEAFGIVQVEALMLGIAVIVSDIPGVRIPAQRVGAGHVVPPGSPAAITAALRQVAAHPVDPTTVAGRARQFYGLEPAIAAHQALLDEAIHLAAALGSHPHRPPTLAP
ncbi:MAG: glycosyltransferase family 4 protein [Candidatus Dormibacteria bacterium]